jgi:hypothetical protein
MNFHIHIAMSQKEKNNEQSAKKGTVQLIFQMIIDRVARLVTGFNNLLGYNHISYFIKESTTVFWVRNSLN